MNGTEDLAGPARRGVAEHRADREAGRLVYPVVSRRSGGLSLGINLFPERKECSFDCPYCEVFPFPGTGPFDAAELERELAGFLDSGYAEAWAPEPIRDLCLSGNGEPSLSPHLSEALRACARARRSRPGLLGQAKLVIITNATGFLSAEASKVLAKAVDEEGLQIWAKLDGGTEDAFRRMSRSRYALEDIVSGIASFARERPVTIQTMLCSVGGAEPTDTEALAYAGAIGDLVGRGARIQAIQLYTKARPAPGDLGAGRAEPIPDERLARLARAIAARLAARRPGEACLAPPVEAFGAAGKLALS